MGGREGGGKFVSDFRGCVCWSSSSSSSSYCSCCCVGGGSAHERNKCRRATEMMSTKMQIEPGALTSCSDGNSKRPSVCGVTAITVLGEVSHQKGTYTDISRRLENSEIMYTCTSRGSPSFPFCLWHPNDGLLPCLRYTDEASGGRNALSWVFKSGFVMESSCRSVSLPGCVYRSCLVLH